MIQIKPFKFVDILEFNGEKYYEITKDAVPEIMPKKFYISEKGTIYNSTTHRFSNGHRGIRDYVRIELSDTNNKRITRLQHAVLIRVFNNFPGCLDLEVNHKNGIHYDNSLSNIELVTHKENMEHAYRTGLNITYGENHPYATTTEEQVREICKCIANGDKRSYTELGEAFGVSELVVVQIVTGRTWRRVSKDYLTTYDKRNTRFTDEQIHEMCEIFVRCKGMEFLDVLKVVSEDLGYEYTSNFRNKVRFIYFKHPGYFTRITNQYDYL